MNLTVTSKSEVHAHSLVKVRPQTPCGHELSCSVAVKMSVLAEAQVTHGLLPLADLCVL